MTTNKQVFDQGAPESDPNCTLPARSIVLLSTTRSGKSVLAAKTVIHALAQDSHVFIPTLPGSHPNAHLDTAEVIL